MRMNHEYIAEQDLVGRYVAGTLPFDERARFEAHFVDCPRCLDALEDVAPFQNALRAATYGGGQLSGLAGLLGPAGGGAGTTITTQPNYGGTK